MSWDMSLSLDSVDRRLSFSLGNKKNRRKSVWSACTSSGSSWVRHGAANLLLHMAVYGEQKTGGICECLPCPVGAAYVREVAGL